MLEIRFEDKDGKEQLFLIDNQADWDLLWDVLGVEIGIDLEETPKGDSEDLGSNPSDSIITEDWFNRRFR